MPHINHTTSSLHASVFHFVPQAEGSTMQFLRRGYKTSTWWEDDAGLAKSDNWRS